MSEANTADTKQLAITPEGAVPVVALAPHETVPADAVPVPPNSPFPGALMTPYGALYVRFVNPSE